MSERSRSRQRRIEAAAARGPAALDGAPRRPGPAWLPYVVLMAAVFLVYMRVWHAGFAWDDDAHVIRPDLRPVGGLWRIWFEPGATQQYYPLLYSAFWLELRLWGYSAQGYHLANLALHGAVACLLYRALRRLSVPGAFLAACAFALHPVCAESVAWISEQKNTLSAVFYLAAALAYLRFDDGRRPSWYALGILLFGFALLSKTVTATLPAALLVVIWWKRGGISWRRDVAPLAPWLAMGAVAGAATAWMEQTHVGAGGDFALSLSERFLVAGRAVWFYLGKAFWPANLVFIYPRWALDPGSLWQVLCPVTVVAALAALFRIRRISRGPLAAALLFVGTLFPALGFVDAYPFRFSFVADHFEYMALAMLLSGVAAGVALAVARLSRRTWTAAVAAASCVLAVLAFLTWRQSAEYSDVQTLWRSTIVRNPGCWLAENNLGLSLMAEGLTGEAAAHYRRAIEISPGLAAAHNNLGIALMKSGRTEEAVAQYRRALELDPGDAETHNNLAMALRSEGRLEDALVQYGIALEIRPNDLATNFNLANALLQRGRVSDAIVRYERALEISPDFADAHNNLGNALRSLGRVDEAIEEYRKALAIDPSNARALGNLNAAASSRGN